MFRMSVSKWELDYLYTLGEADTEKIGHRDRCKVITYDYKNREIVMMMETTHAELSLDLYRQLARE